MVTSPDVIADAVKLPLCKVPVVLKLEFPNEIALFAETIESSCTVILPITDLLEAWTSLAFNLLALTSPALE